MEDNKDRPSLLASVQREIQAGSVGTCNPRPPNQAHNVWLCWMFGMCHDIYCTVHSPPVLLQSKGECVTSSLNIRMLQIKNGLVGESFHIRMTNLWLLISAS